MKKIKWFIGINCLWLLVGCTNTIQKAGTTIENPIERGLMYIATAIVIHGIMQIIFRD